VDPDTPPATDLSNTSSNSTATNNEELIEEDQQEAEITSDPIQPHKPSSKSLQPPPSPSANLHQSPDKSTMWASSNETAPLTDLITSTTPPPNTVPPQNQQPPSAFCGRPCKPADTCYVWWAGASLHLLSASHLASSSALRSYLLELTQHPVMGGFSKFPGDKWADLYHSYLGLVALSLASTDGERARDGVKSVDAGMCVSREVRGRLEEVWEGFGK
jgi:geranylgeranyl transferase type-1 subunit beta